MSENLKGKSVPPFVRLATRFLAQVLFVSVTFAISGTEVPAAPATIKVEGMRTGKGYLAMSLFAKVDRRSFPSDADHAIKTFYLPLDGKTEIIVALDGIEDGDYAVSVMHDEEADHKMHFNFVGIPIEGFGFSNNPRVYFGPPSFERAKIHVSRDTDALKIKMKYFL